MMIIMESPTILIVEDECLTALELQNNLKNEGYKVPCTVSSGEEAIKKVSEIRPDLIIMDIMLKGKLNGIESVNEIKKVVDVPIIYLTAYGDEGTLQSAKITEPHAYLLKPFNDKEVKYAIEIALYKHKMEMKLKKNEKQFKRIYYKAPIAYQLLDEDGKITEVNKTWLNTLGYSRDEVIGQSFNNFILSGYDDPNRFLDHVNASISEKIELELLCKDCSVLDVELKLESMYDDNELSKQILCTFYNVSEYKKEHNKLKASEIQKEVLLEEINNNFEKFNQISNLINSGVERKVEYSEKEFNETEIKNIESETCKDDFAVVDFKQYIESLVNDLLLIYDVNSLLDINLKIEDIILDLDTALSYGLILNELLINAFNNRSSNLKNFMDIDFHLSNERLILTLNDNCNDYSKMINYSSFKLIGMLVKQQRGTIIVDENKKSEIRIVFGELDY